MRPVPLLVGVAAALAALAMPRTALATELEWHFGGTFGWSMRSVAQPDDTTVVDQGFEGALAARLGVSDAFDLTLSGGAAYYPEAAVVAPWGAAGVTYVIDVGRWIPHVGVDLGVTDFATVSCADDPTLCVHDVRFTVGVPAGLEFRIVPEAIVGLRFRYAISVPGPLANQIFLGAYGAFAI
jgi:hypothetical protein